MFGNPFLRIDLSSWALDRIRPIGLCTIPSPSNVITTSSLLTEATTCRNHRPVTCHLWHHLLPPLTMNHDPKCNRSKWDMLPPR